MLRIVCIGLWLLLASAGPSFAQMFSVQEEDRRDSAPVALLVRLGVGFNEFSFNGALPGRLESLAYSGTHMNVSVDLPGLSLFTSFGGGWTGAEDRRAVLLGARISNGFRVYQGTAFGLFLPGELQTEVQRVFADFTDMDFQQSSLRLGLGMGGSLKLGSSALSAEIVPGIGFSYSQGSVFGGSIRGLRGEVRLLTGPLFGRRPLSAGYRLSVRDYDVDGVLYDYTSTEHSFTIGVGF